MDRHNLSCWPPTLRKTLVFHMTTMWKISLSKTFYHHPLSKSKNCQRRVKFYVQRMMVLPENWRLEILYQRTKSKTSSTNKMKELAPLKRMKNVKIASSTLP